MQHVTLKMKLILDFCREMDPECQIHPTWLHYSSHQGSFGGPWSGRCIPEEWFLLSGGAWIFPQNKNKANSDRLRLKSPTQIPWLMVKGTFSRKGRKTIFMQRKWENLVSRKGRDFHQELKEPHLTFPIPVLLFYTFRRAESPVPLLQHWGKEGQKWNDPIFQLENPRQGCECGCQAVPVPWAPDEQDA